MKELSKQYDPKGVEGKWYAWWVEQGFFHADAAAGDDAYSIVIPPPNVTGILHMGHALNNTLQDVLIRVSRMRGRSTCWIPGTDHASIATEAKVVAMLADQGIIKEDLTREEYLEHAWAWKEKYGGIIIEQLQRLGCSCDWERERFTMDSGYTRAVLEAFVRLYNKGLIYRGMRLVNWCPVSQSAISDEEVNHREVTGSLWHFRYSVVDGDGDVVVATTRPETMLGDSGVAVHPEDDRYRGLIGKRVWLPLAEREIPVIADAFVDPEFGTGCVKVTPAHDPNDFEMGVRHDLPFVNIMDKDASLNENVPEAYRGLSREEGRKKVLVDLEAAGLLVETKAYTHQVGYSERGGVPIEYYLSEQWFMKMEDLAPPALEAVRDNRIRIHPEHWTKTYAHWMENIQDWCISRQLWWGQRIPVWYRKGADRNDPDARHVSVDGPSDPENWEQDEDVLDTWASSWLWPFAVHSWPGDSDDEKCFYPTNVLVTAPDIIFFWVARMIMAGFEFKKEIPFSDVYIHGIVRDDQGRKMNKSLGNTIDPLQIIDQYSADALRFSLIILTATGQDVQVSDERFEIGRNFGTKIWNAARFMLRHTTDDFVYETDPTWSPDLLRPDDRQVLAKLHRTITDCDHHLAAFRFNDVAKALYEFIWHQYCDWYVESAKEVLYGDGEKRKEAVLRVMHHAFSNALRLLHPLMPFLTEELWHGMEYTCSAKSVMIAPWPQALDPMAWNIWGDTVGDEAYVDAKHQMIRDARVMRSDYNLAASKDVGFILRPSEAEANNRLESDIPGILALLKADSFSVNSSFTPGRAMPSSLTPLGNLYMPLEGLVDIEAEREKLNNQLREVDQHLDRVSKKLDNENFVNRAPEEVVAIQRDRHEELLQRRKKLSGLLGAL